MVPEIQVDLGQEGNVGANLDLDNMAARGNPAPSLHEEINEMELEAQLESRHLAMEKERAEVERCAKLLTEQACIEV